MFQKAPANLSWTVLKRAGLRSVDCLVISIFFASLRAVKIYWVLEVPFNIIKIRQTEIAGD